MARGACLVLVPAVLYLLQFVIFFAVLFKAGPHDDMMSSAFQASLQVHYRNILLVEYLYLRPVNTNPFSCLKTNTFLRVFASKTEVFKDGSQIGDSRKWMRFQMKTN